VVCVDKDFLKIGALKRGEIPIYEPGLQDLVGANVQAGRLSFATALEEPVGAADGYSSQSAHRRDGVTGMRISPTSTMQPAKSRRRSTVSP
jgi:UDP-glucose/GDP-mannose dehydrogenase family, NAD binding domain